MPIFKPSFLKPRQEGRTEMVVPLFWCLKHKTKNTFCFVLVFFCFLDPRTDAQPVSSSIESTQSEYSESTQHPYFLQWCFHAASSHQLSHTHTKSIHFNVPITTEALFHNHHQLQNLFFQVSFLLIINYLKTTNFFNINNKICSRLRNLWTPFLSHHHSPRLHNFL